MIAALFVAKGGCYWDLPDVDPWDVLLSIARSAIGQSTSAPPFTP